MTSYVWPPSSGTSGIPTYATFASLPAGLPDGSQGVTLDTDNIYVYNAGTVTWVSVASPGGSLTVGSFGSTPNSGGASISGGVLTLQPADGTHPGGLSIGAQTIAGNKTFSGSISASNLSGTNTGDQTITLTADVTGSGTGSFATSVAKIQGTVVSGTTGSGNVVFSASPTLTGTLSAAAGSFSGTLGASNLSGTNTGDQTITLTSDVTGSGTGSFATTIANSAVTNAKMANMASSSATVGTVKANISGSAAAPSDVVLTSANTASSVPYRDGSGNFSAGTITAALTGTASGNTTYSANNHGVVISSATNAMTVIAPDASATKVLKSGGSSADPSWLAYDNANTASTLVFRDSSNNFSAGTITASLTGTASGNTTYSPNNHGVVLSGSGNGMTVIAPNASTSFPLVSGGSSADPAWAGLTVPGGGTGVTSATAYSVLCGGTTSTGNFQSVASVGTSGQVLTSNGAGALPTFQSPAGTIRSTVIVDSGNGFGSSSTKIRRFTNTRSSVGSDITYADSATLGGSFTINSDGLYFMEYNDANSGAAETFGITVNDAAVTTNAISVTYANGMRAMSSNVSGDPGSVSWLGILSTSDVIRAHASGGMNATNQQCMFTIIKISS